MEKPELSIMPQIPHMEISLNANYFKAMGGTAVKGGTSMRSDPFIPTEYDIFGGLDVGKKSIAVTFTNRCGCRIMWSIL